MPTSDVDVSLANELCEVAHSKTEYPAERPPDSASTTVTFSLTPSFENTEPARQGAQLALLHSTDPAEESIVVSLFELPLDMGRVNESGRILDKSVSRKHCRISEVDGVLRITDLSSTNGTFVNGRRISSTQLFVDDLIGLGKALFVCISPNVEAPAALRKYRGHTRHPNTKHLQRGALERALRRELRALETGSLSFVMFSLHREPNQAIPSAVQKIAAAAATEVTGERDLVFHYSDDKLVLFLTRVGAAECAERVTKLRELTASKLEPEVYWARTSLVTCEPDGGEREADDVLAYLDGQLSHLPYTSTFVGYGKCDEVFGRRLVQALLRRGIAARGFLSAADPSKRVRQMVQEGVTAFDSVILACSKASLNNIDVLRELRDTLDREGTPHTPELLIPVDLDQHFLEYSPSQQAALRTGIWGRVLVDFTNWQKKRQFKAAVDRLLETQEMHVLQSSFISYGGPDEAFAVSLNEALRARGARTFLFKKDALPGVRLSRVMHEGVNGYDRVILVCSEASLHRPGVLNEIQETLARESRDGAAEYLIPIRLDDYVLKDWAPVHPHLAQAIRDRVVADFRDASQFDDGVAALIRALMKKRQR